MPRAKCRICGAQLDTTIAYKVVVKGANKYFCSKEEFDNEETKKQQAIENKNKTYSLMCDILGVEDIVNTALWKEYNEWLKVASASKISDYLGENKDYLIKVTSRLDNNQFARIRYISAVLKNNLADFQPKKVEAEKNIGRIITEEDYETKYKPKTRKPLIEFEEEYDE
jgi:YHS domain-containing protein